MSPFDVMQCSLTAIHFESLNQYDRKDFREFQHCPDL